MNLNSLNNFRYLCLIANFIFLYAMACSENKSSDLKNDSGEDAGQVDTDTTPDFGHNCQDGEGIHIKANVYSFNLEESKYRIEFLKNDLLHIEATKSTDFSDPTKERIVVANEFPEITTECLEHNEYFSLKSDRLILRVYKDQIRFAMYKLDNKTVVFEEESTLELSVAGSSQTMKRGDDEHFYGGGMQNGYFSHRDSVLNISVGPESDGYYNWDDGGHPNPAPFYMSNQGYGVFRNTFSPGTYDFGQPVQTKHMENRFDAYYFYGPDLKSILDGYTEITGRPFMAPIWGFEFGDADCYNGDNDEIETTSDIIAVADEYRDNDMPGGWMLPNDGYGCGYVDLPNVITALHERGFYTGLWTEDGLDQIEWEVSTAGSRIAKLDIAWVWKGYEFALDAAKTAAEGLETFGDSRRFVWTTMGWAGTQRYAVMWTGDNKGNWEYIRFQIPTVIGSGLSAQNYATGDIDGIFWGRPQTYVRDLQWKVFTPVLMTISGWSNYDKQPWRHGEPFTTYNRNSLKLKMRLTPYLYTYAAQASNTGVPIVRAMVLEYPDDPITWGDKTQYQFMSGEWFLVAPVYSNSTIRNDIYLPEGKWIDYHDGTTYTGPMVLDDYDAPLEKLPVFVKSGAIIPMWPSMLHHREKIVDPLTLDIYPNESSEFELYEDDGLTLAYKAGEFATQLFECHEETPGLTVVIGANVGDYTNKLSQRGYILQLHTSTPPSSVSLQDTKLPKSTSATHFETAKSGWFYDSKDKKGILYVKTDVLDFTKSYDVKIEL